MYRQAEVELAGGGPEGGGLALEEEGEEEELGKGPRDNDCYTFTFQYYVIS